MKQLKNTSAEALTAIHGLSFTVFFIIEQLLDELAYPYLATHLAKPLFIAISAIIAAGLYAGLFLLIRWLYNAVIVRSNARMNIEGLWYHVHIPHRMGEEDYTQARLSAGTTTVSRDLLDFTLRGDNERCYQQPDGSLLFKRENATHWYTKATKLSDENDFDLIEVYEAKTKGEPVRQVNECPCCRTRFDTPVILTEAEPFRHGVHKIDIKTENGVTVMQGEYSDCWPSLKTGEIFFYRTRQERDERIRRFFADAEEWRRSHADAGQEPCRLSAADSAPSADRHQA